MRAAFVNILWHLIDPTISNSAAGWSVSRVRQTGQDPLLWPRVQWLHLTTAWLEPIPFLFILYLCDWRHEFVGAYYAECTGRTVRVRHEGTLRDTETLCFHTLPTFCSALFASFSLPPQEIRLLWAKCQICRDKELIQISALSEWHPLPLTAPAGVDKPQTVVQRATAADSDGSWFDPLHYNDLSAAINFSGLKSVLIEGCSCSL